MKMEVYYSKKADLALIQSDDGVIMSKVDDKGQPGEPELVYDDTLENVFHEYARLGIDDWQHADTVEVNENQ